MTVAKLLLVPENPSREECMVCKGPHWDRDGPTAIAEQNAIVEKMLRERCDRQQVRVKRVTADSEPPFRNAVINAVLDVSFCPDTGSDVNTMSRPVMAELKELMPRLLTTTVDPP